MSGSTIKQVKPIKPKEASLDNPTYKVKLSTNGAVSTIFVFNGNCHCKNG